MENERIITDYKVVSSNGKTVTFSSMYFARKHIMEQLKSELILTNKIETTFQIIECEYVESW